MEVEVEEVEMRLEVEEVEVEMRLEVEEEEVVVGWLLHQCLQMDWLSLLVHLIWCIANTMCWSSYYHHHILSKRGF
ncbi:hypothetical protein D3C80_2036210 [compost metagenome]